jgi:hypothetical protein
MIEEQIGPYTHDLGKEVITLNIIEEARLSMEADNNLEYFETWKSSLSDDTVVLDSLRLPKLDASYDMDGMVTKGIRPPVQFNVRTWLFDW